MYQLRICTGTLLETSTWSHPRNTETAVLFWRGMERVLGRNTCVFNKFQLYTSNRVYMSFPQLRVAGGDARR